jgi:hypothetical protein
MALAACSHAPPNSTVVEAFTARLMDTRRGEEIQMTVSNVKVDSCYKSGSAKYTCIVEADIDMGKYGGRGRYRGDIDMLRVEKGWTYGGGAISLQGVR